MANAVVGKFETLVAANSAEVRNANRFPTQTDERQLKLSSVVETRKRILFVTPEITDFVKAGGLGEVSAALPRALSSKHDVRVLIPGYRPVMDAIRDEMQIVGRIPALAAMPAGHTLCRYPWCRLGRQPYPLWSPGFGGSGSGSRHGVHSLVP